MSDLSRRGFLGGLLASVAVAPLARAILPVTLIPPLPIGTARIDWGVHAGFAYFPPNESGGWRYIESAADLFALLEKRRSPLAS